MVIFVTVFFKNSVITIFFLEQYFFGNLIFIWETF